MCRSKKESRDSSIDRDKELEKLYSNLEEFHTSSNEVANAVVNIAKDVLSEFNEKAKEQSKDWFSQFDRESQDRYQNFRQQFRSFFLDEDNLDQDCKSDRFSKFHQLRDRFFNPRKDWWDGELGGSNHEGLLTPLQGLLTGSGRTPFGLYAYKTPSTQLYNDCVTKNGESVWDSQGYWRCLFPNLEIPLDFLKYKSEKLSSEILTKEDLNLAIQLNGVNPNSLTLDLNKQGLYFRKFDDYLNWKNLMYENIKAAKQKKMEKFINDNKDKVDSQDKHVISSTLQSNLSTNPDSNLVELKEIKTEFFNDGTSLTTKITKSKPYGAEKWENVNETVEKGDSSNSKGWFWK